MRAKILIGAVIVALNSPVPALAGGAVAGATEPTQILNMIQLVMSYVEQAQQTATQMKQYETMVRNLMSLSPSGALNQNARQLWQDQGMVQVFSNLRKIVVDGQSVAYTMGNMDTQFKKMYPGYGGFGSGTDFFKSYQGWSDNTLGQVKNAVGMVTAHSENFATEEGMVQELMNASNSAQGQLQAVQAGNQIGVAMVGQMQKLRQLQMAQMQAQNAYIAGQQSRSDSADDALRKFFTRQTTRVQTIDEINASSKK